MAGHRLLYLVATTWLGTVGGLSLIFVLAILGPQSDNASVAFLYKWIIQRPVKCLIRPMLFWLFGPRISDLWNYVVHKPNPLVQIFYLFMVIGGYSAFIYTGFPLFDHNSTIPSIHRWTSLTLSSTCLILFTGLSTSNPGFIRSPEVASSLLSIFPPSQSMLSSHNCRTCKIVRPGRSKHCRYCGFCCCKYDHHCIWVNNCIGLLNWRLFMVFLLSNFGLCLYGALLIPRMILVEIDRLRLREAVYLLNGVKQRVTNGILLEWTISHHTTLFALGVACGIFGLLLAAFISYHLYLHFWLRKTTNEYLKDADIHATNSITYLLLDAMFQDLLPIQWLNYEKEQSLSMSRGHRGKSQNLPQRKNSRGSRPRRSSTPSAHRSLGK